MPSIKTKRVRNNSISCNHKKQKKESTPYADIKNEEKDLDTGQNEKDIEIKEDNENDEQNEEENDTYRWWEELDENNDKSVKWTTLHHQGVMFPPPYEPLPQDVKLIYDGKPIILPIDAEEVAGFYGAMLYTTHAENLTFQKNFFNDFKQIIKESNEKPYYIDNENENEKVTIAIDDFKKCDFTKMYDYFENERQLKKSLSKIEKKDLKISKDLEESKFKNCIIDGRIEMIGNFRIEPPGLFRGRGIHPKTGKLKRRVLPEQITLNLSKDAEIPNVPMKGHKWGNIVHDNTVVWLATWKENINNSQKYVALASNSSLKGISDFKKFEKARNLKNFIEIIRKDYIENLKSPLMLNRQIAVATYLIDRFALRAGGEKNNEDEADTVGCCSLRYEHVTLKPPNIVIFDFLGKDSIRYYQQVEVDHQVFKDLRIFKKSPKEPGDDIFDRIDPSILNKYFQNYMPGLSAKVFRTYNASKTMQDEINKIPSNLTDPNIGTIQEKLYQFNSANRTVAILCNHQRSITSNFKNIMERNEYKIKEMKWNKIRLKKKILELNPNYDKEIDVDENNNKDKEILDLKKDFKDDLGSISKDDELKIHQTIIEREVEKITKKFNKENEKLKEESKDELSKSELDERLKQVDKLKNDLNEEFNTGIIILENSNANNLTIESLETKIKRLNQKIENSIVQLKDKEDNAQVALGTSKTNYIDPRLIAMFSKKFHVPIEKLFTKTMREKFNWAIKSADADWKF